MSTALGFLLLTLAAGSGPSSPPRPKADAPARVQPAKGGGIDQRLALCNPFVEGDAKQARPEAILEAAKAFEGKLLPWKSYCQTDPEAILVANMLGLRYALMTRAQASVTGSQFTLSLTGVREEKTLLTKQVDVARDADAVKPLKDAFSEILLKVPTGGSSEKVKAGSSWRWEQIALVSAGAAALVAGGVYALSARSAKSERDRAPDLAGYIRADDKRKSRLTMSVIFCSAGGAAAGGGLIWRFAF